MQSKQADFSSRTHSFYSSKLSNFLSFSIFFPDLLHIWRDEGHPSPAPARSQDKLEPPFMLIGSWKVAFWHGGTRPDQQQVPSRWGVWHSPSGVADWAQDAPGLPSLPEARETKRRSFPAPRRANRPRRTPESPATSTPLASPTREHAASPAACGRHLRPRPCTGHLPPRPFPLAPAAGRQGSVVKPGPGNFTRGNSRGALRRRRQSVSFGGGGGGRGGEGGGGGWGGRGVAAVAAGTCAG